MDLNFKISDALSIIAILISPLLAVQLTMLFERKRKDYERRYTIFKTLLTTRSNTLSIQHVEALNSIDAEFNEKKFSKVLDKWNLYLQHLNHKPQYESWNQKSHDLLVDLIHEIGVSLKINFDKSRINQSAYYPNGHWVIEEELTEIRKAILDFLRKNKSLRIEISKDADNKNAPLS
ncbi:hypothetical protein ND861_04900 [Leptospira sp. 2 VSF19]|uniref:DUF6680 domain-containing protein n=1 Tax=Leptospira soteropolitanensis TaxID=2950025 RepID=A0AAW5VNQ2_9LEPT|nr:DUF6680 family protein [Leptospira soteropolitanensis]MCW7491989.1 hypothetical protein [Leptospira soteropolitanensis]MCW7499572.1 hypothetical protein [Leptospira soteropolitanensis]MCW7521823.1 hypothetical protein [Leptospira soteropolitanensis]MCW7525676.1 hypothetical protein [Leptospira soteropolitanensis]MCW7530209.1 hypothetical protein [Leptospira soteropolitanensis]